MEPRRAVARADDPHESGPRERWAGARGTTWLTCLAVLLAAIGFALAFSHRAIVMSEEGQILTEAEEILAGRVLYRDIDCFVAPGVWYLTAALVAVFGPDLNATRVAMVVVFGLTTAVVWATGRLVAGPRVALAGAAVLLVAKVLAFPLGNFIFYTELALLAGLACIALLVRWLATGGRGALAGAGVCLGACILSKQNIGLALALAMGTFLAVRDRRALVHVLAAAVAPCAAAAVYFASQGALGPLVHGLFVVPFSRFYGGASVSYLGAFAPARLAGLDVISYTPALFARAYFDAPHGAWSAVMLPASRAVAMLVYALPAALTLAVLVRLVRPEHRDARGVVLLLGALALYVTAFPRADFPHVVQSLLGFAGVGAWLAATGGATLRRTLGTLLAGAAVYAAMLVPAVAFPGRLETPRARVWLPPQEHRVVTTTLDWIARSVPAGDAIVVVPYEAMYYFLTGRLAPHRYTVLLPPNVGEDGGREAVELTEAAGVRWVVETTYRIPGLRPFAEYAPAFAAYLRDRYRPVFAARDDQGNEQLRILERVRGQ